MAQCSPGDKVLCHIKSNKIVTVYEEVFDDTQVFEIIANYSEGYLIYIPLDFFMKEILRVDSGNYKKYGLDKKFIDSNVCHISDYKIAGVYSRVDGLNCKRCKYFSPMAAANQVDGSFLCWSCTTYRYR
jgi:hypothetical protein